MKRALILLVVIALPAAAAQEKWWDAYNRGVKAVNAKSYDAAVAALQKAMAEMPVENTAARTRNEIIVYVPHFWLGIAKFNLGDVDGALREWKTSEEQGAIEKTDYYSKLRDWVARAQTEKLRNARDASAESRKSADAALNRALAGQMEALSAGGDRTDTYRAANRKLQEALSVFNSAGSEIKSYERAAATAADARMLFDRAADEGKRMKAARPVAKPSVAPPIAAAQPVSPPQPEPILPVQTTATVELTPKKQEPAPSPLSLPEPVGQKIVAAATPQPVPSRPVSVRAQLESAYRAFATGDFNASERVLTSMLSTSRSGEAYLLRGCVRYTRAMLSRTPDLESAKNDFKAALQMKRSLRLDQSAFSPKLIAFFEEVRKGG
ncbi:MAG TPA: hypothetical protein VGS96_02095 [Thermoanaerobaculia bacterium]|jgi:hypothetical protein|nr:hypothetical protein [Thermoanaerobaculia bacterium]